MFQVRLYEDFAKSQAKKGVDDCMTATAAPEQKKKGSTHVFQVCSSDQAFRFMMGPGHCPMISKYGPSLSKAVDPSFLVVKREISLIKKI